MEALKRKRTQFRREFSIAADNLEQALQTKEDSSENFSLLSDCAEQLFSCESAIRDLWCEAENFDEAAYQADQDRALEYRKRWSKLKSRYEKEVSSNTDNHSLLSAKSGSDEQKVKLPELEITKFDGNVKKWLSFWGQFKKIDQDPCIADTDKIQYLLQSMEPGSSARNIVASYPPCGENYSKALGALKSRFAREDVLIETYVRGLLQLMQEKSQPRNSKELSTLYDSLQTHLQALETLGVTKDKYVSILFPMVESALPEDVLRAWNRNRSKRQGDTDLTKLVEFLREEVESEERIELARQNSLQPVSGTTGVKEPTCCFVSEVDSEKVKSTILCIWCEKDGHSSSECHKANKMSYQQRVEHVKAKKACLICLRQNHMAKRCKSFPKCLFCRKRHLTVLCPDIEEQGAACRQKTKEPEKSNNLLCGTKLIDQSYRTN